jgi:glycosyltransferase involved in cell wall biosynthesis
MPESVLSADAAPARAEPRTARRVLVVIENIALGRDHRARKQVDALVGAGYEVSVISPRHEDNAPYRRRPGVRLLEYPPPRERSGTLSFLYEYGYSLLAASALALKELMTRRVDAVQCGHPPDLYVLLALPFKLARRRFVVDQRDLSPELFAARYGHDGGLLYRLLRMFERRAWRAADHVVCVNQSLRSTIVRRGDLPPGGVTVVGNGPVLARTAPRPPRPELRRGRRHLGCWLGVMGAQDHVDLALRAVHELVHARGRTDCQFAFIGDGEMLPELRELAAALGIADWVTFTGWLDEDGCFDYLATTDVAMDSNLQVEVSPVKGLEYMAFAVPFVAFDLEATRAMAERAAVYVPPGDAMALAAALDGLLSDPVRREEMGRRGRERVESELSWDRQSEAYLRVYEGVMGT